MDHTTQVRDEILDAARAELMSVGASGLTVRAVAAGAGCSTTGIYTYFGGKQGLLDALYAEAFEDFHQSLYGGDVRASAGIRSASHAYHRWALAHPTRYLLMFAFRASGYVPTEDVAVKGEASFFALVELVDQAVRRDELEGDSREIAAQLWAVSHGYAMLTISGPGDVVANASELQAAGTDAILRAYATSRATVATP